MLVSQFEYKGFAIYSCFLFQLEKAIVLMSRLPDDSNFSTQVQKIVIDLCMLGFFNVKMFSLKFVLRC